MWRSVSESNDDYARTTHDWTTARASSSRCRTSSLTPLLALGHFRGRPWRRHALAAWPLTPPGHRVPSPRLSGRHRLARAFQRQALDLDQVVNPRMTSMSSWRYARLPRVWSWPNCLNCFSHRSNDGLTSSILATSEMPVTLDGLISGGGQDKTLSPNLVLQVGRLQHLLVLGRRKPLK